MAAPPGGPRCPQCRALVPAGSAWCMLCHADLRSDAERAAARAAAAAVAAASASAPAAAASPLTGPGGGRHRRGRPMPGRSTPAAVIIEHDEPEGAEVAEPAEPAVVLPAPKVESLAQVDLDAMLEQLAAESSNRYGELSGRLTDKSSKVLVVAGGSLFVTAVVFLGMLVLGSLFG